MKFVIITPAKNEGKFIGRTISSVIRQRARPLRFIIVDDCSDDDTADVVRSFQSDNPWIELVSADSFGVQRSGGAKVVRAFNVGFSHLGRLGVEYDFLVKLDADLELPEEYFEKVVETFASNPRIGMCGGFIENLINGKLVAEEYSQHHVRGAFKSVRRECFEVIGGFRPIWNWDSVDEVCAMYHGWEIEVFNLPVTQFRPTSGAYASRRQQYKDGYDAYCLRNSPALLALRFISRLRARPFVIGALSYLLGYINAVARPEPISIEPEIADYYNSFHVSRILSAISSRIGVSKP